MCFVSAEIWGQGRIWIPIKTPGAAAALRDSVTVIALKQICVILHGLKPLDI